MSEPKPITLNEARARLGMKPLTRIIWAYAGCGHEDRRPCGADAWAHRCTRRARLRYRIGRKVWPDLFYPRYCGSCGTHIMAREQWATTCVHCDPRARAARAA